MHYLSEASTQDMSVDRQIGFWTLVHRFGVA
jgi:hypothetical protein